MALSGNLIANERQGADLLVQKINGQKVRGELIAVKENSLLLLDADTGADVSVDIQDIKVIRVLKKAKFVGGAGIGFLIGSGLGILMTSIPGELTTSEVLLMGPLYIGIPCALIGGLLAVIAGPREKIHRLDFMSQEEIKIILEKLRKKARIPDYE